MSFKERIIHMLLFEVIALAIIVPVAVLATGSGTGQMTLLAVLLSLLAMFWNYAYNLMFDRIFGEERIQRGFKLRIVHGVLFELGMILVSFPLIMWILQMDFLTVLIMDLSAVVFYLIYAIVFNWGYDQLRHRYFVVQPVLEEKGGH